MWYFKRILAQLKIIALHFGTIGNILWSYARTHQYMTAGVAVTLLIFVGIIVYFLSNGAEDNQETLRSVRLIRVGDVSQVDPLSVIGEIRAISEANVSPETSGTVKAVYAQLGEFIGAGAVIAELDNAIQRAQVSQARAAVEKVRGAVGAGELSVEGANQSYVSALQNGVNAASNAYVTINDAIQRKTDGLFSSPKGTQPRFIVSTSDVQTVLTVESGRLAMQPILVRHAAAKPSVDSPDVLLAELEKLSDETSIIHEYLSNVILALNNAIPTSLVSSETIGAYRADANAAVLSVTGIKSSVVSAIENIKIKKTQVGISVSSLAQGSGKSADLLAAEAQLEAAEAGLEKTVMRAPISGTINRLDLDVGNFVNASIPVVYIANARALEAVVYVSARDLPSIERGQTASIAGLANGVVNKIAQALDPFTKKAEIRISIPASAPFVSGQSATIEISRKSLEQSRLQIPITALKITPDGPVVFSVEAGVLVSHPIKLGLIRGSHVEIESGLIDDMRIVEDARGLKNGQSVTVSDL